MRLDREDGIQRDIRTREGGTSTAIMEKSVGKDPAGSMLLFLS
jgi:hypothetical protein